MTLQKAFDGAVLAAERRAYIYGFLGRVNADTTVTVVVQDRPNFFYTRIGGRGEPQSLTIAKNINKVPARAHLPVRMRREGGVLVIHDVDYGAGYWEASTAGQGVNPFGVLEHTHARGTGLDYMVEAQRLEPGLVQWSAGLTVSVEAFRYNVGAGWTTFLGDTLDLTDNVPTTVDTHRWVLVALDTATNTLTTVNGDEEATSTPLTLDMLDDLDVTGLIPLAGIQIEFGNLSLSDYAKFFDVRGWLNGGDIDTSGFALLVGRAGGQHLRGGTAASENLQLESTSHATKGFVLLQPSGGNVNAGSSDNPISLLTVVGEGGLDSATPPRITIRNKTNGTFNNARQEIASLDFYSDDVSGVGATTQARISLENYNTVFGRSDLAFSVAGASALGKVFRISGSVLDAGVLGCAVLGDDAAGAPLATLEVNRAGQAGGADAPTIMIRNRFNGTFTAADQRGMSLDFYSDDASGGGAGVRARIAAENDSTAGSTWNLGFYTSNNTTTLIKVLHLDTNGNAGVQNTNPQASLHVGVGTDAPTAANTAIYASNAGQTQIVARDSTNDVEVAMRAGTTTAAFGTVTNHALLFNVNNAGVGRFDTSGNFGVGVVPAISSGVGVDVTGSTLRLRTSRTPASAGATGNAGEICWDASFIYVCTATNTWKRVAIATW